MKSIVFLGRLVSDKGVDMLLRAFSTLQYSEWSLTIIGDGPEKNNLENLSSILNISSSINFTGYLKGNSLIEELNRHEIMVVPLFGMNLLVLLFLREWLVAVRCWYLMGVACRMLLVLLA